MCLLLLAITGSGLISLLICVLMGAAYGLELILLPGLIRNVHQENSKDQVRKLLNLIILDHAVSALEAAVIGTLVIWTNGSVPFLPMLQEMSDKPSETGLIISIGLIFYFFAILWTAVGVLLMVVKKTLRRGSPLRYELDLEGWLNAATAVGVLCHAPSAFFFLLITSPLIWQIDRLARIGRQSNLIWTLTVAVQRGLPLSSEIMRLSEGMWGKYRLRLELFSENLAAGQSIANSLERQPGLVLQSVLMQIRLGEETGTLNQVLAKCSVDQTQNPARFMDVMSVQQSLMILLIPVTVAPLIMGFIGYFIIPKFRKIFDDFGIELPGLTTVVFQLTDERSGFTPLLGFVSVILIGLYAYLIYRDWEREWPVLLWLFPRINAPPVLRAIALLIRENSPLIPGLEVLEYSHVRPSARRQVSELLQHLTRGADTWDSLARERLISRNDVLFLRAAERLQNLPWALEQIADSIDKRLWYRMRTCLEIVTPLIHILMGWLFLLFIAALMMPLFKVVAMLS